VEASLQDKYFKLKSILADMKSVLVGFSGGSDSTLLLKVAHDVLGNLAVAVTAESPTLPKSELEGARQLAKVIGAEHASVCVDELKSPEFVLNPPERCYHCKKIRFSVFKELQVERGLDWFADGTNIEDEGDWRPGIKAAIELGIRSPLKEAGFMKQDIRELSRFLGLPTWDKPSMACLASRVPYGEPVTKDKMRQVAEAEDCLRGLGYDQLRVRHHGSVARIEVPKKDIERLVKQSDDIVDRLKAIGFNFVSLDLSGFKSGSMNTVLNSALVDP